MSNFSSLSLEVYSSTTYDVGEVKLFAWEMLLLDEQDAVGEEPGEGNGHRGLNWPRKLSMLFASFIMVFCPGPILAAGTCAIL